MNAAEEAADDAQYNESVAQFATGYAATQGRIANLTGTNTTQHYHIASLQLQVTQSANNAGQVMYCPPVQQPMMQMQMPL